MITHTGIRWKYCWLGPDDPIFKKLAIKESYINFFSSSVHVKVMLKKKTYVMLYSTQCEIAFCFKKVHTLIYKYFF